MPELPPGTQSAPGRLLPIFRARRPYAPYSARIAGRIRFISSDAIPVIADALNLTRAEVHGVVTFYHDFRHEPCGIIFYSFAVARLARALEVRAWRQPYSASLALAGMAPQLMAK